MGVPLSRPSRVSLPWMPKDSHSEAQGPHWLKHLRAVLCAQPPVDRSRHLAAASAPASLGDRVPGGREPDTRHHAQLLYRTFLPRNRQSLCSARRVVRQSGSVCCRRHGTQHPPFNNNSNCSVRLEPRTGVSSSAGIMVEFLLVQPGQGRGMIRDGHQRHRRPSSNLSVLGPKLLTFNPLLLFLFCRQP